MKITVDLRSAIPPYEQVRSQIEHLIAIGVLAAGLRLPAIRQLAADLGIATGTVARAYRELETQGLVQSRRRGTFVSTPLPPSARLPQRELDALLGHAALTFANRARQLGVSSDVALDHVRRALTEP
nr:GntR family transcriptional regulator [Micromonospora sp. DSM 115978]